MFVSRSMTREVITVDKEATIFDAQELLAKNKIRHLPIIDKDRRLVGIITDRDIRSALPYNSLMEHSGEKENERVSKFKVKDMMTKDPISISPAYTIQDALLLIQKSKVGALPVVDDDLKLTGIISVRDLLRAFQCTGYRGARDTSVYSGGRKNRSTEKNCGCDHRRKYLFWQCSGCQVLG